jgi:hypothetical protein
MMDRRVFLKMTGLVAVASALEALPVAAEGLPSAGLAERTPAIEPGLASSSMRVAIREPGTYRISGQVRLDESSVEISGISNRQWISWSNIDGVEPLVADFTSFEHFDRPGLTPAIQVRGGRLESLTVVPVDFD